MQKRRFFKRTRFHLYGRDNTYLKKDTYISKEEYIELRDYAQKKNVKITNFKKFSGDTEVIKEIIDDIYQIAKDFPLILEGRRKLELTVDYLCNENVFATTEHHIIFLNASLFSDIDYLKSEYNTVMSEGKFVANTDYRSIVRHEVGHVVANIYKINPLEIAKNVLKTNSVTTVIEFVKNNLSLYSGDYVDGREIISESFSGYYSGVNNAFADEFVKMCINAKGGNINEEK